MGRNRPSEETTRFSMRRGRPFVQQARAIALLFIIACAWGCHGEKGDGIGQASRITQLQNELASENASVRARAVVELGKLMDHGTIDILKKAAKDEDFRVRARAVSVLTAFGGEVALPTLEAAAADPHGPVRLEAVRGIATLSGSASLGFLKDTLLHDKNASVRKVAAEKIAELAPKESVEFFGEVLEGSYHADNTSFSVTMSRMVEEISEGRAKMINERALTSPEILVQLRAFETMQVLGWKTDKGLLEKALSDSDAEVRIKALRILAGHPDGAFTRRVEEMCKDGDKDVRIWSEWTLKRIRETGEG